MPTWLNILTNAGVLVFVMFLFRILFNRVDKLEDRAVRREEFSRLSDIVSTMQVTITRIDEHVKFLAEKNGYGQKN
jgi:uncharacterized coiled-coil protein SlyX